MVNAVVAVVGLVIVAIVYKKLFRDLALDEYREGLFTLRNELFALAQGGNGVNFHSQAYKDFEHILNNAIRFAHRVSLSTTIIFMILNRITLGPGRVRLRVSERLNAEIDQMREGKRKDALVSLRTRYEIEIIRYLFKASIIFKLFVVVVVAYHLVRTAQMALAKKALTRIFERKIGSSIDFQADLLPA